MDMVGNMKVHKIREPKRPCFLFFWKKVKEIEKTICGKKTKDVFYSPDRMAITCKSCKKLMNKVQ